MANAARKAEDALEDAGKEASSFGDYLKAGAVIEGAKGIISSLKDVAEETKAVSYTHLDVYKRQDIKRRSFLYRGKMGRQHLLQLLLGGWRFWK